MSSIYLNINGRASSSIHSRLSSFAAICDGAARIVRAGGGTLSRDVRPLRFVVGGAAPVVTFLRARANDQAATHALADYVLRYGAAGAWTFNGVLYIDACTFTDDETEAKALAASRGELAIWDNDAGAEISTDMEGTGIRYTLETDRMGKVTLHRSTDAETVYFQSEADVEALLEIVPELFEDSDTVHVYADEPRASALAEYFDPRPDLDA